jgi:phosphate uptake regulator
MIWPCTVISSILILLNKENEAITRDSLTGLNNRRNIESNLLTYVGEQNRTISLIMLDIDDFNAMSTEKTGNIMNLFKEADATISMVKRSIDAFVNKDRNLAEEVRKSDDIVDNLFNIIKEELIEKIQEQKKG